MVHVAAFEKIPFLRALSPGERRRVTPSARMRTIARGDRLWSEGELANELTFVTRGRVKLVKTTESGRDAILQLVAPGELLCPSPTLSHTPHFCTCVAMEETDVLSLRRVDVLELIEHSPAAAREMVREVCSHVTKMYQRVEELSSGHVEQRVAKLLLRLADGAGVEQPGEGIWVPVPLSRQDLADLCGTTLETAIRVMSALRRRQLVRSSSSGFLIQDRAGLHDALGGKREASRRPRRGDGAR